MHGQSYLGDLSESRPIRAQADRPANLFLNNRAARCLRDTASISRPNHLIRCRTNSELWGPPVMDLYRSISRFWNKRTSQPLPWGARCECAFNFALTGYRRVRNYFLPVGGIYIAGLCNRRISGTFPPSSFIIVRLQPPHRTGCPHLQQPHWETACVCACVFVGGVGGAKPPTKLRGGAESRLAVLSATSPGGRLNSAIPHRGRLFWKVFAEIV